MGRVGSHRARRRLSIDVRVALSLRNASQRRIRGITLDGAGAGSDAGRQRFDLGAQPGRCAGRNISSARRSAPAAADWRPASGPHGGSQPRRRAVRRPELLRSGQAAFAAHHDGVGTGSPPRPPVLQGAAGARPAATDLQKEMLASLAREADRPQSGVQMVRGRATNTDRRARLAVRVSAISRRSGGAD